MATREGRCPNCGSIIQVNPEHDNHCVFCWAPVDADQAIELGENAEGHVFPNEKYEEPDQDQKRQALSSYLNPAHFEAKPRRTNSSKPVTRKPEKKLSAAEQVAKINRPVPQVHLNKKALRAVLGTVAVVLIALVAISVPMKLNSLDHHAALIKDLASVSKDVKDLSIKGLSNQYMTIVEKDDCTEEVARERMQAYSDAYRKAYGSAETQGLESGLELRVYGAKSSFLVKTEGGKAEITKLP